MDSFEKSRQQQLDADHQAWLWRGARRWLGVGGGQLLFKNFIVVKMMTDSTEKLVKLNYLELKVSVSLCKLVNDCHFGQGEAFCDFDVAYLALGICSVSKHTHSGSDGKATCSETRASFLKVTLIEVLNIDIVLHDRAADAGVLVASVLPESCNIFTVTDRNDDIIEDPGESL